MDIRDYPHGEITTFLDAGTEQGTQMVDVLVNGQPMGYDMPLYEATHRYGTHPVVKG